MGERSDQPLLIFEIPEFNCLLIIEHTNQLLFEGESHHVLTYQQENQIGDEGAKYIADALHINSSLTKLSLGVCFI